MLPGVGVFGEPFGCLLEGSLGAAQAFHVHVDRAEIENDVWLIAVLFQGVVVELDGAIVVFFGFVEDSEVTFYLVTFRLKCQSGVHVLLGEAVFIELEVAHADVHVRVVIVRLNRNGPDIDLHGILQVRGNLRPLGPLGEGLVCHAEIVVGAKRVGVVAAGFDVAVAGFGVVAVAAVDIAFERMRRRVGGVDFDRTRQGGQGGLGVAEVGFLAGIEIVRRCDGGVFVFAKPVELLPVGFLFVGARGEKDCRQEAQ